MPLHWRGQARSIAFIREQGFLRAEDSQLCGFIPMLGENRDGERSGYIDTDVALYWDTDQSIESATLQGVLTRPRTTAWSGATVVPNKPFDRIWLRLTGTEPGTCRIAADPAAVDSGLCTRDPCPQSRSGRGGLAGLFHPAPPRPRRASVGTRSPRTWPSGVQLAERLCEQIRAWDRARTAQPVITAHPAATSDEELPDGMVIDKRHIRLVVAC